MTIKIILNYEITCTVYFKIVISFILRRLALTLPVAWIVVTLVFSLIHLVPGDPVAQMLGEGAATLVQVRFNHQYGVGGKLEEI